MDDTLQSLTHSLIGCDWGRKALTSTPGVDLRACEAQAAQRMAFHDPATGLVAVLRFCPTHVVLMKSETDPHAKES
jgi:hypothetical protein